MSARVKASVGHLFTGHHLALFALSLFLITFASPVVSQSDDVADNTADDVALDKRLSLQIEAPKDDLIWGDELLVRLTAANAGAADIEAVALSLHDQPGIAWSDDFKGQWLELGDMAAGESRVIEGRVRVEGLSDSGTLSLFATLQGRDVEPAEASVALAVPGLEAEELVAPKRGGLVEATAGLEAEELVAPKRGSLVEATAGRVLFTFPDGWNESDARLTFHLREQFRQEKGDSGRLLLFTVEAAAADDNLAEAFDKPIEVTVNLSDLVDPEWSAANPPVVSTRRNDKENWTAVESRFDPKTGVLSFSTSHFSSYQVTTDPQLWKLPYNPPGASPYTGAATYQYPIDLPPGIGGLTPELSLHYSSRSVDSMKAPVMSQGFGAGWSLPQAQITNGNSGPMYNTNGCCNFDKNAFTLVLNGVTYNLSPAQGVTRYGRYYAVGQPEILVEYLADDNGKNDTNNVSGEFWRVRTGNGTTYTFGRTMESEQVVYPVSNIHNLGQLRNKLFSPYNWKLDLIQDVHGNKVEYIYGYSKCGLDFYEKERRGGLGKEHNYANQCTEVDTAVSEIRYNFSGGAASTTIVFTYGEMNYNATRIVELMNVGVYRPTRIDVKQKNGSATATLSSYLFTYHPTGFHYFSPWVVSTQFWMLATIGKTGANGNGSLPTQTFTYEMSPPKGCDSQDNQGGPIHCVKALKRVDNGYGAVTEFSYAKIDNKWMHVTTADTWDGVAAKYGTGVRPQSRLSYDRTNQAACYDTTGSACHMGLTPPSDALVGFNGVTVLTQEPGSNNTWTTLARQTLEFRNNNYWLLGKIDLDERFTPGGVKLSRSDYQWLTDGAYVMLDWEAHATYDPLNNSRFVAKTIDYAYYPNNPAGGQYGGLMERKELDETNTAYRCTRYEYAQNTTGGNWLINYPLRETLHYGTCDSSAVVADTLYRYAGSATPTQTALDDRGLLTYVLRLTDASTNKYSMEMRTYTTQGLQKEVMTFSSAGSSSAYATNERNRVSYEYTALGMPKTIRTTAAGVFEQVQTISYDPALYWLPISVADPNSIVTRYGYDLFGRLSKVAMPGDTLASPTMTYDYYDDGAPTFTSPLLVGVFYKNNIKSAERQFYDGLGRLVQTQTARAEVDGADKDIVATTAYDARGLAVCTTVPYAVTPYVYNPNNPVTPFRTAACTTQPRTTTAYDALGRVTQVTTPDGAVTGTAYGVSANITVDGHGKFQSTQITDANNHQTVNYSDVFGRLVLVREFTGSGTYTAHADTRYSYDAAGNLTMVGKSVANNSQPTAFLWQTTMQYDKLGRKTNMSDPDMREWAYIYGDDGNLIRQEHRTQTTAHHVTCFYYDNLNRLLYRANDDTPANACPGSAPTAGANHLASYTYGAYVPGFNNGRLREVGWGPNPTQNKDTFAYDAEGRLFKQTRIVNGRTFEQEVTAYDALDRPTKIELPSGEVVITGYDEEGVNSLKAESTTLISGVGYNERGQLISLGRPGSAPATTLSYHGANKNFRLSAITTGGSSALPDFTYGGYDLVGNLTNFTAGGDNYQYTYDDLNRLKTVTGAIGRAYTYDQLGNFDLVTVDGQTRDYAYASGKPMRLMSVSNLSLAVDSTAGYDTWGNMRKYTLQDVAYELNFNTENRLASVKVGAAQPTVFAYDPDGQRVMTTQPDGTIIYTPFPDYEVTDPPTGADTVRTTYRLGGRIVAVQTKVGAAGTFYFTYTDHLGNISAMSTIAGVYVADSRAWYDPFGTFISDPTANPPDANPVPSSNPAISNHGFTGHRHNNTGTNNLGLIYMNARYYLPEIGRFISPDTIVPEPGNPQSYNRYAYVRNNPMNFTDPTGHREIGANENDLLPNQASSPTLSGMLSSVEPVFNGLPVDDVQWANGFGANKYAAKYGDPSSRYFNADKPTYRNSAGLHSGIDFGVAANTNVYSNVYGKLVLPPPFPGDAGPNVMIQLTNGMLVTYGHVNVITGLTDGMEISPGMLIGTVVDKGSNSHLHLALREGARTYNPAYFFSDPSTINTLPYSDYVAGENLYSISSFLYQPDASASNYWADGARRVGVWR